MNDWIFETPEPIKFAELLKSENSQVDFAGPTLPSLKLLLDRQPGLKDPNEKYAKLVHGILSACLLNIDEMGCVSVYQSGLKC